MAANSKIQWTTHTFNPWRGCSKVHTGCANCYAEATSKRNETILGTWGPNGTRVVSAERAWSEVLKWNKAAAKLSERPRVFCASLADIFEDWQGAMLDHHGEQLEEDGDAYPRSTVSMADIRARLFKLIDATPNLDWMLLTKRPENVRRMWCSHVNTDGRPPSMLHRANVWLGTSVSDQATADKWIPELLKLRDLTPVLFVSAEPLIGPVDLSRLIHGHCPKCGYDEGDWTRCAKCGHKRKELPPLRKITGDECYVADLDLVIVGGESGHGARPCNVEWIRSIVNQCAEANVDCFVKQLGANVEIDHAENASDYGDGVSIVGNEGDSFGPTRLKFTDPKGGNPDEWPEDLRVRQMPERI